MKFKNILALSPHTDDIEMGAGGTIAKLIRSGARVKAIAFSWCDNERLKPEFVRATEVLGINEYELLDYPRRQFYIMRQEILDYLWRLGQNNDFDLILCPSSFDIHQDHKIIYEETVRAFRHTTIFGYEIIQNALSIHTNAFVRLNEEDVQKKINALMCYSTQQELRPDHFNNEYIRSILVSRGARMKTRDRDMVYAEAFEVIRYVHE